MGWKACAQPMHHRLEHEADLAFLTLDDRGPAKWARRPAVFLPNWPAGAAAALNQTEFAVV